MRLLRCFSPRDNVPKQSPWLDCRCDTVAGQLFYRWFNSVLPVVKSGMVLGSWISRLFVKRGNHA
jgi:hypothetical protein